MLVHRFVSGLMAAAVIAATACPPVWASAPITVVAEGMAPFVIEMSLDEVRGKARDQARRNAIEQAVGVFIRGATTIRNAQITDDLVTSLARGVIEDEQWLDERIEHLPNEKRSGPAMAVYYTRIKAAVRPVRVEHRADFTVRAALNKEVFQQGEEAIVTIQANQPAFLYLFSVTQDGSVTVLLPNRYAPRHAVSAQEAFTFPSNPLRAMGIRMRVELAGGAKRAIEHIKVIATKREVVLVDPPRKGGQDAGFQTFAGTEAGLIQDIMKRLAALDDMEWTEATVPYEIRQ